MQSRLTIWLYLIEILHQTTTSFVEDTDDGALYLIEILHQTTTCGKCEDCLRRCILSKFYIKPQLAIDNPHLAQSCILSKFYIKPQLYSCRREAIASCILSKFYIKPQLVRNYYAYSQCCILSKFYIKPQLWRSFCQPWRVVSYRNSTSNHNSVDSTNVCAMLYLIEILHQTTTRNSRLRLAHELYLIEILHQTTTCMHSRNQTVCCILSKFYIKPQPAKAAIMDETSCILSKFYIKPQLARQWLMVPCGCILSKFYIKPQLFRGVKSIPISCILSKFYIKPQLICIFGPFSGVVSYRNSTSNHNYRQVRTSVSALYLIEILHQTTTGLTI